MDLISVDPDIESFTTRLASPKSTAKFVFAEIRRGQALDSVCGPKPAAVFWSR